MTEKSQFGHSVRKGKLVITVTASFDSITLKNDQNVPAQNHSSCVALFSPA